MSNAKDLSKLFAAVEQLDQPRGKYLRASDFRTRCEDRAARVYTTATEASGLSNRAIARRQNVDERIVRDDKDGNRAVHVWKVFALPIEAQIAFARALVASIAEAQNEADSEDDGEDRCA